MITLFCITAFTMLVTEASAAFCPSPCKLSGAKCVCTSALISFQGGPRMTSESEAELATLAAAVRGDESLKVEIVGDTKSAEMVRGKLIKFGLQPDLIKLRSEPGNPREVAVLLEPKP